MNDPSVVHAINEEHANELCNLICGAYQNHCTKAQRSGCWSWSRIDPFKLLFLEVKYKRREKSEL